LTWLGIILPLPSVPANMKRRILVKLSAGAAAAFVVAGFRSVAVTGRDQRQAPVGPRLADLNPDRMWPVYRRYHLLIVGQRDDERGLTFAAAVAKALARFLPTSRALLVRAPDSRRVGVLIATNQQDVAIMAAASAEALFLGKPPFADIRDAPLRVMVSFGSHLLVCRPDFRPRHAYIVAKTLAEHTEALPAPARPPAGVIPAHRGSRAFFAGEKMPDD
jgi:hypothetical protein